MTYRPCIKIKNELNRIAEVGWKEKKTTRYISRTFLPLEPIINGFGESKTGLLYQVGKGSKGILLRADIDGLQTENGAKHTCGHSSHTAGLMQALLETVSLNNSLIKKNKSIYFLFQPSEENYPSGAKAFIDKCPDILPHISYAFSAHVKPLMPVGTIGLLPGAIWARGDYMEIEVTGKMVHVKDAPEGKDALEAAAYIILFVKSLQKEYGDKTRINIGVVNGGLQANTVAGKAILKGDIRLKDEGLQKEIKQKLISELKQIEKKLGLKIDLHYFDGYPVVKNDPQLTQYIQKYFKKQTDWKIASDPSLFSFGCEDFCFISEKIPSVMAFIGTGDKHDIHEPDCTISDEGTYRIYKYFSEIINWWLEK